MANFSGSFISDTYQRVLQLDTTLQDGTGSLLQNLPITASHAISASYAVSASVEIIKEVSSSYADTASYVETSQTASYIIGSNVDGIVDSASLATDAISSSFSITSSFSLFSISSSQAVTASFLLGSVATASYVETAQTASYIELSNVTGSASIATRLENLETNTGDFAVTSSNQFTGSQFFTGSLIPEAIGGNGIYDVGSQTHPWKDLYISTSSLKFVKDAIVIADLNGEDDGVRIGNIFIGTGSISVVSGSGNDMTVVGNIITTEISGGIVTPIPGDAVLPSGSISSSAQIEALGFTTSSAALISELSASLTATDQYILSIAIYNNGEIADLALIDADLARDIRINSSSAASDISTLNNTVEDITYFYSLKSEVTALSSSASDARNSIAADTGSFITTSSLVEYLPTGSISSSAQITDLGFVSTSSYSTGSGESIFSGSIAITPTSSGALEYWNLSGSIIPTENEQYDLGSAEYKIRHLFLSDNSIYVGDNHIINAESLDNQLGLTSSIDPILPNSPGNKGDTVTDTTHVYICINPDVWVRTVIETGW